MSDARLLGTWALHEFFVRSSDGRPPMQPFKRGLLMYAPDGWMSAILSSAERPALGTGGFEHATRSSDVDKARAFDSYLSYAGRYRIEGDEIVHRVEHSLVPDVIGTELRRHFVFTDAGLLQLHYERANRPGLRVDYELIWQRTEERQP